MEVDEWARSIGTIVIRLSFIEFILRAALLEHEKETSSAPISSSGLESNNLKVGDMVPLDAFTNYDTLGQLIQKYNTQIARPKSIDQIDSRLVELRDALAHGRISVQPTSNELDIVKFDKPTKEGKVKVTLIQKITHEWVEEKQNWVDGEYFKVLDQNIDIFPPNEFNS